MDVKILVMRQLGIALKQIARSLTINVKTVSGCLDAALEMVEPVRKDVKKGMPVPTITRKHKWPEPLV
jgi:transcriptional regulator